MARKEKVTKIIDGDAFMTDRRKHPVRLANVDTPEKGQSTLVDPGGQPGRRLHVGPEEHPRSRLQPAGSTVWL